MNSSEVRRGSAPARVNLIGEHVDYMGGKVLPLAVDRRLEVECTPAPDWRVESSVAGGEAYLVALGSALGLPPQAVRVKSRIPAGAGLSSSAAFLIALARALARDLDPLTAVRLCRRAEEAATGVAVGVMDHVACALGRRGFALWLDCSTLSYEEVAVPPGVAFAVVDSGVHRRLADTPYARRREEALAGDHRRLRHVESEVARVEAMVAAMKSCALERMGELVSLSHASLRDDFEVSTPLLDEIVSRASRVNGCLGARLMGAGFGGSVLALLHRGAEARLQSALAPLRVLVVASADGAYR